MKTGEKKKWVDLTCLKNQFLLEIIQKDGTTRRKSDAFGAALYGGWYLKEKKRAEILFSRNNKLNSTSNIPTKHFEQLKC